MKLTWGPQFELGIAFVDRQHKRLIDYIIELESIVKHQDKNEQEVFKILKSLNDYALAHFTEEQDMLQKISYTNYDDHLQQHQYFFIKLKDLEEKVRSKEPFSEILLLAFLESWLFTHISTDDRAYLIFIKDKGIDISVL